MDCPFFFINFGLLKSMVMQVGFNNGTWEPIDRIAIPVTSVSVNRGYGAFEFFEVVNGRPFYGERHLARFRRTMELLRIETQFDPQLEEIVSGVIARNEIENAYLKLFALPHQPLFDGCREAALYVFPVRMPVFDPVLYAEGAWLITRNFERFLPEAKSTNYLAGQYWMDEQSDARVVDVLFHNGHTVHETSRGNIFAVKDGAVITPGENMLKGVTRSIVLELLAKHGILHAEAEVSLSLLYHADELFVTSTTKHVLPIVQVDGLHVGNGKPGPVTCALIDAFANLKAAFGE